jgi:hypothetical protein
MLHHDHGHKKQVNNESKDCGNSSQELAECRYFQGASVQCANDRTLFDDTPWGDRTQYMVKQ